MDIGHHFSDWTADIASDAQGIRVNRFADQGLGIDERLEREPLLRKERIHEVEQAIQ
jgi:hypothetical protein